MPHGARRKGESGFYHVVPKGIADQLIFEDDEDRELYLRLLREARDRTDVRIHAYCLMSNHVHLVVEDRDDRLAEAMKHLHERYGAYYAEKVGRTGGIFRRPYWSEPIDSDNRLLCAVRYVHANPAAAGICPASKYAWSSVGDYLGETDGLAETATVLGMLGGRDGFVEFSREENSTAAPFPGSTLQAHLSDDEAATIARQVFGTSSPNLMRMGAKERREPVRILSERGFTLRQMSRIFGVSTTAIARLL